ncbi:membrane integrity-associated transporter subunit PqiC [Yersinia ruckeri]|uniref:membrane integrity-associated transporter subunit PqiC n=1 Tax=Yersinia ruckeri TaxID=29486 RepID=UPI0011A2DBCC|nr:membrane integrity-associated transporter subunit PqiC [Yersinia ruckeri]EKN3345108.1 membrane integrity-associated transporter subunit PqiC [Yersinia ruckeri]EKN3360527.1 membrane integrity-associated transporter subunit PqiC [Yersinia ruckeri]EKN4200265.1 membrane integrity-associated transporter subunit PqiC [Yersinia ruckeri]EKN4206856.1 membrane integrity-associated transporter subunit PqiC [Yersinia ruckeri]EKN4697274.1 membrane integrity-associated transporter subunit PqiC [Yersinia 
MMKWMMVVMALVLSACSSSPDKTYYQLPALGTPVAASSSTVSHQLWLEHVSVADYLAASGVVYQTNDVQYVIANNNLWASPLDQQLQQTLVTNLSSALPNWLVSAQPLDSDQAVLNVTITGFHGRYDGKVVIKGVWILKYRDKLIKQPFDLELKQNEDGYDALVRTLAQGWQQEAQRMATQLQAIK